MRKAQNSWPRYTRMTNITFQLSTRQSITRIQIMLVIHIPSSIGGWLRIRICSTLTEVCMLVRYGRDILYFLTGLVRSLLAVVHLTGGLERCRDGIRTF